MPLGFPGKRRARPPRLPQSKPLRGHHRVVVAGGGVHGLAAAHALIAREGIHDVAVLESGWLGRGSATRAAPVLAGGDADPAVARLTAESQALAPELARQLSTDIGAARVGQLTLAHSEAERETLTERARLARRNSLDAQVRDPAALRRQWPRLGLGGDNRWPVLAGLHLPRAHRINGDALAWGYAHAIAARGGAVHQHTPVSGLRRHGGAVAGVHTPHGEVSADAVLLAGDDTALGLAPEAGVSLPAATGWLRAAVTEPAPNAGVPPVDAPGLGARVVQLPDGELLVALRPAGRTLAPLADGAAAAHALMGVLPGAARLNLLRQWDGSALRPHDGRPLAGPSGVPGLWLSAGWGDAAVRAAPACGRALARALARDTVPDALAPVRPDRHPVPEGVA